MVVDTLQRIEKKLDEIKESEVKIIIISVATAALVSILISNQEPLELVRKFGDNQITNLLDLALTVLLLTAASYGVIVFILWIAKKIAEKAPK